MRKEEAGFRHTTNKHLEDQIIKQLLQRIRKVWKCQLLSCVWLFVTPWNVALQAPLSMEFSNQEYWSGLPFPSTGDLPDPRIEPGSPALQADSLLSEAPGSGTGAMCAKSLQLGLTLWDPMNCSPPGSSVHGIFQARGLEWGAIAFSTALYYCLLILHFKICLMSSANFQCIMVSGEKSLHCAVWSYFVTHYVHLCLSVGWIFCVVSLGYTCGCMCPVS